MKREAVIRARITQADKEAGERILEELGMSTSDAIHLFWSQLIRDRGMPFAPRLVSDERQGDSPRAIGADRYPTPVRRSAVTIE